MGRRGRVSTVGRRYEVADAPTVPPPPPPFAWESASIPGPDGALHLRRRRAGHRVPILFVHGLAGHGRHWTALAARVSSAGHPVAAPDLRGHGKSDLSGRRHYEVEDYASDLEALVHGLGWRRFVLVGHSLGAAVAIEYSARHGKRVDGLVLVDPNGDMTGADSGEVAALVADVEREPHREFEFHFRQFLVDSSTEVTEAILADLVATAPEVLSGSFAGSMTFPVAERLRAVRCPVALLVTPLNRGPDSLPVQAPEIPRVRIGRTGHWVMLDRPDVVHRFLAERIEEWEDR